MDSEHVEALSSEEVGRNLLYAGLFLIAAELIGKLVVTRVRDFYANVTFGPGMPFKNYELDVSSRNKDTYKASVLFLRDHLEALTSEQVLDILAVRTQRNALAHELSERISSLDPAENERLLERARNALFSLSNLWTRMDIGADPEFASMEIDWAKVHSDDLVLLDHVIMKTRDLRGAASEGDA